VWYSALRGFRYERARYQPIDPAHAHRVDRGEIPDPHAQEGLSADILADASQHAALYNLVVIGEALNKVSAEVKSAAPILRWRATGNLRNVVVHAYWQVDLEIIADVIEKRLLP
jgi:hypothetical protein